MNKVLKTGKILIPKDADLSKWSVVACDQYTSQPEYWDAVSEYVGDAPSTLHITLPEIYLEGDDVAQRIESINANMQKYIDTNLFKEIAGKYIYVERTQRDGVVRHGLMGVVDLEEYDYRKGSQTAIRATEGTVLERIPPRVRVRENASLELPHIMLLIDDRDLTVIEPLFTEKENFEIAYDFTLMQDSGSIRGYIVDDKAQARIDAAIAALADKDTFCKKYSVGDDKGVLLFAVGDGNHSLATAKECYERIKAKIGDEAKDHPARYALVEVTNVHDKALEFEPIHRVVFDVDPEKMMADLAKFYELGDEGQGFVAVIGDEKREIFVKNAPTNLAVGTLQKFIDEYLEKNGGRVDYIHGDDVVEELSKVPTNIGFLLPPMEKEELFPTVILDGALPRKTFSMGHAYDKRFYLEARKISR
ncbi:MAG: DUF1015 domain-containing protein [Clostridia bacterium]|nr:DUF1015 domain-containing protein [Clostridia bacterium]